MVKAYLIIIDLNENKASRILFRIIFLEVNGISYFIS